MIIYMLYGGNFSNMMEKLANKNTASKAATVIVGNGYTWPIKVLVDIVHL